MGLASLNAALAGLRVSQQQISVISNNISNASTPGFTRKILPQSAQSIQGVTVGVLGETIVRNVDLNLQRDLWTQISSTEFLSVQETYLSRIEQFHGPPDRELSVAAELARLQDSFAALADSPEDTFILAEVTANAVDSANKINDLADLVQTLRNDAQDDILITVNRINDLLEQIAQLNNQIEGNLNVGRTTALPEDERDEAIKELSGLIDISFFTRGDGVLVVQTAQGEELASDTAQTLTFSPTPVSALSFYSSDPTISNVAGIFIGDPTVNNAAAVDITSPALGGRIGALVELRDVTFPKQTAQLDELAHKMALRFEAQGLRLFTDTSGNLPLDTAPDPTTLPTATPVEYIGFASRIQVNTAIIADNTIISSGTSGGPVQPGSNEVILRILEFTFGPNEFQEAIGAIDMRSSLQAPPNNTLQNWLGLYSENQLNGTTDLTQYASVADIITAGGTQVFGTVAPPAETDSFTITFDDPDFGTGPHVIDIDLRAVAVVGPTAADDLIAHITADADWATAVAEFGAAVSIGANGQLVIDSRSDITIAAAGADPMSNLGFAFVGFTPGTTEAVDPYFDIRVGNDPLTRITIDPNDDETDLFAALSAVPGLAVEDFTASADGFIRLRPGNDYTNPDFGGGIDISGGPFQVNGAGIGAGTLPDTLNIVSALFGSFSAGPPLQDLSPLSDVSYQSQTDASATPPIPTTSFRTSLLGPGADISTNIVGVTRLLDFAQKMVNEQTQQLSLIKDRFGDEETLREILQNQLLDESGVNVDEELGNLIVVQTAFAASARVINVVDELFRDLLDALR